jgi:MFS family permease
LTCGGLFGQFYAFDNPSALNEQLKVHLVAHTSISPERYAYLFSWLYSVYSMPNMILPLLLGIAVDRCGTRVLICVLACSVVLGHALFSLGVGMGSWPIMLAGRIVFGFGGESVQVAQNCLLFRWFKGREVAFALGLNLSLARAGSVLNDVLSPWAAQHWGVVGAMWLGTALCVGSCVCNVWSVVLDKSHSQRLGMPEGNGSDEEVSLRDVLRMPRLFWLLSALCVVLYCGILPFNNIASAFLVETRYNHLPLAEAQQRAGNVMSLIFLASAFGTPPFGSVVDKFGMRGRFLMSSSALLTLTYISILNVPPAVSMLCLGTVYTIFAGALWPAFALAVPQAQLGTAYGVATALQNTGLAVVPLLVGYMQARAGVGHFEQVINLFVSFGVLGVVICTLILDADKAHGCVLELPSQEAERHSASGEDRPLRKDVGPFIVEAGAVGNF